MIGNCIVQLQNQWKHSRQNAFVFVMHFQINITAKLLFLPKRQLINLHEFATLQNADQIFAGNNDHIT